MSRGRSRSNSPRNKALQAIRSRMANQEFDWSATLAELFNLDSFDNTGISFADRAVVIVCATNVELCLEIAIKTHFIPLSESQSNALFLGVDRDAPLSNFGAKIRLAHALGILGPLASEDIKLIQQIRNLFAHSAAHVDFSDPAAVEAIDALHWPKSGYFRGNEENRLNAMLNKITRTTKGKYTESCKHIAFRLAAGMPGEKKKGLPIKIPDVELYPYHPSLKTPPQVDK